MTSSFSRRQLLSGIAAAGAAGAYLSAEGMASEAMALEPVASEDSKPKRKYDWPIWDSEDEKGLYEVLQSGQWGRTSGGPHVPKFERMFAERMQAKYCIATSSGTTALLASLGALGIGPGDEVVMPPYTFVATFNAITHHYALPVFADVDPNSFQIDPKKVLSAITPNTKLLLPVHIGGSVVELDELKSIADTHHLPIIEDACQAPFAEWRGKPIGTAGLASCYSFQASKNLTAGEGGAILTNDESFANQCYNFHSPGGGKPAASIGRGSNYRLTSFQASLLVTQFRRVEAQAKTRNDNALYLSELLRKIPGVSPAALTSGCTKSAWHLYMIRYQKDLANGKPRAELVKSLQKEGVAASTGYNSLPRTPHVQGLATNPHYRKIYGAARMDQWLESIQSPVNDQVCEEALWLSQTQLLGTKADMEKIAEAFRKGTL